MSELLTPGARRAQAALVFLAALAYFLLFHRYGFFIQDEGVIAYQALRVSHGQLPYTDFQTAYTPASFYLNAVLFRLFGPSLALLRAAGSVTCAATAALLFLSATRVLPPPYALLPSLLYVVLEDQESHGFVVHTIAYPARYVEALWAMSLWLTLAHARRPRRTLAAALGLLVAAIAAFKHNVGIYNAWGAGLSLILVGQAREPHARAWGRGRSLLAALPLAFVTGVLATLLVLFGGFGGMSRATILFFALPMSALLLMLLPGVWPWGAEERRRHALAETGGDVWWLAAGAFVPSAVWIAYFVSEVGLPLLLRRVVREGAAAASTYAIALPAPGALAVAAGLVAGIALSARGLVRRGYLGRATAARGFALATAAVAVVGLVAGGRLVAQTLRMGEWELAVMHFGRTLDNLGFYLVLVVAYTFLPRVRVWLRRDGPLDPAIPCWVHGLCQLLLAHPRLDVAHLYQAVPILLIPGTLLLCATLGFYRDLAASAANRWLSAAAVVAVVLVATVKLIPRLDRQLDWRGGVVLEPRTPLAGSRGGLYATEADGGWFAALNRTVALVQARTAPDEPVFAYPALPGIYFLSGRPNPSAMDYWFHGFGEGHDEVAAVTALEQGRVPLVVRMRDESFDPEEEGHFPVLKDYLRRHFVETAFFAPFHVLERVAAPADLFQHAIPNGDFATGTLAGFRGEGVRGGAVTVVRQGVEFSAVPGAAEVPFPNGPRTHAALLRSRGDGRAGSVAILTSLPFVAEAPALELDTLSESPAVRLELLFLDPGADILEPAPPAVQARILLAVDHPGTGPAARFTHVRVPFPAGAGRPVKIQLRQQTLEPARGWFTLVTNLRAGAAAPEPDRDGDGIPDAIDDCPDAADPDQTNSDGDRWGDACDNCPYTQNNDQADRDADGIGDRCATDLDGDGHTDEADIARLGAALGGEYDARCDLDGDGRVDLADVALFARELRVGIASDDLWDFTLGFVDHGLNGGLGIPVPRGMVISAIAGSDLIAFPGPLALAVRSGTAGDPASEGALTSLPFVPTGPRLTLAVLSEDAAVAATVRVLRPGPNPRHPRPEDILVEAPLRNDHPGTGPSARFVEQTLDIARWFDAARPLRSPRIQVQVRQHTLSAGHGYFTLVGDMRTGS